MQEALTETNQEQQEVVSSSFNPFSEAAWVANPAEIADVKKDEAAAPAQENKPTETTQPTVDYNAYLKEKFGFDNEEVALSEFNKLKQQKPELKFENEVSEKFFNLLKDGKEDDVYSFLTEKKKLDKLATATVDNVDVASEILKLSFQKKYSDLSPDEVEYMFSKRFAIPEKPVQGGDELDEEYEQRVSKWEAQKALAEKELIIEAKLAKPEIEKYKADLKLPEITKPNLPNEPTEEELKLEQEAREKYLSKLDAEYNSFEGFNVAVKNEEVDIAVAFTPTEEEKTAIKQMLSDFDAEDFLAKRWLKDGEPDVKQAMEDIYLLLNGKKALQKLANDSANKTFEQIVKKTSNIQLGKTSQPNYVPSSNKTEQEALAEFFFSQT